MILIDREREMEWLESVYKSKKAELGIIYGRRRIGKTHLIKAFINNKQHFYFLAKQQPLELEIERFREKLGRKFNVFIEGKTWEQIFAEIKEKISSGKRTVIVIDEFPHWVMKDSAILSEFQYIWDEILRDSNIILILLGSYISVMENVIEYKSPLYGRRTFQIYLQRMPIECLREFFPKFQIEDLIRIYGCADTIPFYLDLLKEKRNFREVLATFFNPSHPLYNDAEIILSSELREYNTYFNIMKSIFDGATKLSEISNQSKVDITNILKYLNTLRTLKLIRKIKPVTASAKERNYIYEIEDNYFKFWLTYIYPFKEEIEEDPVKHTDFVMSDYNRYMGRIFETFCQSVLRKIFPFTKLGRWWYRDKEIDLLALNDQTKEILFAECKWQDRLNPKPVLEKLLENSQHVDWNKENRKETFALFAKSFSRKISEFEGRRVFCFDLKGLERILKGKI